MSKYCQPISHLAISIMKEQLIKYFLKKANVIMEPVKVTVLIGGIVTGIIRDIKAPEENNLFEMHKKYHNETNLPQFNSSTTILFLKNDFLT